MADAKGRLRLYDSYNFTDKDPVIDKVRTIVKREGMSYMDIQRASGVSATTLHNWFDGKTRRPQYCTVMAVVSALGYRQAFIKRGAK